MIRYGFTAGGVVDHGGENGQEQTRDRDDDPVHWWSAGSFEGRGVNVVRSEPMGRLEGWWAMQGLNLRPSPCQGDALPLS